jgi:transcription antitermination factor NusG
MLAESLAEDGYEVWTPVEVRMIRIPRKNVKREVRLPIMPSYVFARAHQLVDLLMMADAPVKRRTCASRRDEWGREIKPKPHSDFDVMHAFGQIPLVPDKHLNALRVIETKRTPAKKADKQFIPGVTVKVGGGSFGGMVGRVKRSDTGYTIVCFNDRYIVKIPTLLLKEDGVSDGDEIAFSEAA